MTPASTQVAIHNDGVADDHASAGETARRDTGGWGLRERVALVGGSFEAGPTAAGGYRVHVEFEQ